jgi:hypothetical protein
VDRQEIIVATAVVTVILLLIMGVVVGLTVER